MHIKMQLFQNIKIKLCIFISVSETLSEIETGFYFVLMSYPISMADTLPSFLLVLSSVVPSSMTSQVSNI